jgi:TonB family protein
VDFGQKTPRSVEGTVDKRVVEDQLCALVANLGVPPQLHLALQRLNVERTARFESEFSAAAPTRTPARGPKHTQLLYQCNTGDERTRMACPRLIHYVTPQFTEEARRAQVEGTMVLGLTVDERGRTGDVRVLQFLGKGLDESAVAAAQQWKYKPAIYKDQPIPVNAKTELQFVCVDPKAP